VSPDGGKQPRRRDSVQESYDLTLGEDQGQSPRTKQEPFTGRKEQAWRGGPEQGPPDPSPWQTTLTGTLEHGGVAHAVVARSVPRHILWTTDTVEVDGEALALTKTY